MHLRRENIFRALKRICHVPARHRDFWRCRALLVLVWLSASINLPCVGQALAAPQKSDETYTLSGTVVNSATGEAVAHALVHTGGFLSRTVFSDAEGHFQIDGVPAGRIALIAQKPGYVNEPDASGGLDVGASSGSVTLTLVPQSAIYGRVVDSAGQPIEHVPVRLNSRNVRDGRKRWESHGMTESDEDGRFRFASLSPGTYYLAAGPSYQETRLMVGGEKPKTGIPSVYYPGVSDLTSASPIQLGAGQQAEADFSLNVVPVNHLAGTVSGSSGEQGVGFQVFNQSGDELPLPTTFNMETHAFSVESVPAGSYILKALSQSGGQPLRAETRVNVASSLENLRLVLTPSTSIPIVVRLESRASSNLGAPAVSQDRPPVSVRLVPTEAGGLEVYSTFESHGHGHSAMLLPNVDPGTYTVDVMPQPPWYVQSATYAQSNLLYDELTVVAAGQGYPMEIVLRDDSATMNGTIKVPSGKDPRATIVVVPQPVSKIAPRVMGIGAGSFTMTGLAPGEYLVFAFDRIDTLEYTNPDALQAYESQAAHVTLSANQNGQVALDLIHVGKGD